jgi:hypothetical protein
MSLDNNYPSALKLEPWSNKRLIGGFLITDGIGPGVKYIGGKPRQWDTWPASSGKLQAASFKQRALDKITIL